MRDAPDTANPELTKAVAAAYGVSLQAAVQVGTAGWFAVAYGSSMNIVRDDGDERQIRVDRMIAEFRKAQSRRLIKATTVKPDDEAVEPQRHVHVDTAVARSTSSS
jgi:hypothetical protein